MTTTRIGLVRRATGSAGSPLAAGLRPEQRVTLAQSVGHPER